MNFLRQGFRKLSHYKHADRQTDRQIRLKLYTKPLRLRGWSKDWTQAVLPKVCQTAQTL